MPTIALYARVSTEDQHAEAQLHQLRAYAERRGATAGVPRVRERGERRGGWPTLRDSHAAP